MESNCKSKIFPVAKTSAYIEANGQGLQEKEPSVTNWIGVWKVPEPV
jgi:hypothetical protein